MYVDLVLILIIIKWYMMQVLKRGLSLPHCRCYATFFIYLNVFCCLGIDVQCVYVILRLPIILRISSSIKQWIFKLYVYTKVNILPKKSEQTATRINAKTTSKTISFYQSNKIINLCLIQSISIFPPQHTRNDTT